MLGSGFVGGKMKKIAFLFSIVTLIACSESENDIAMVDSGAILAEESSSSAIEQSSAEKRFCQVPLQLLFPLPYLHPVQIIWSFRIPCKRK